MFENFLLSSRLYLTPGSKLCFLFLSMLLPSDPTRTWLLFTPLTSTQKVVSSFCRNGNMCFCFLLYMFFLCGFQKKGECFQWKFQVLELSYALFKKLLCWLYWNFQVDNPNICKEWNISFSPKVMAVILPTFLMS